MIRAALTTILVGFTVLAGCGAGDDTADIPGAMLGVSTNADVDDVAPGQTLPLTIDIENVYLVMPPATPPPAHAADAGYLQYHLDDEATLPLLADDETHVSVTIPATTAPGPHRIICRLHVLDGRPTPTKIDVDLRVTIGGTLD